MALFTIITRQLESPFMRRPSSLFVFIAVLGLTLAACAGPAASEEPVGSSGGEASAPADGSEAPAESQIPAASQGSSGNGGIGVNLSDGGWSGGEASVDISGAETASFTAALFAVTSFSGGGSTTLSYVNDSGELLAVAIYTDSFAVSVTTGGMVAGGGTTTTCQVDWHSTSDNNISADFTCPDSPVVTTTGTLTDTVNIEGSFTATR
jgi:hypothetical protein